MAVKLGQGLELHVRCLNLLGMMLHSSGTNLTAMVIFRDNSCILQGDRWLLGGLGFLNLDILGEL